MRENTELYQRACEIISRALDAAEGERDVLIGAACGDDADLRKEVDWLYAECRQTVSSVLGGLSRLSHWEPFDSPPSDLRVSAAREYAIVRELGRGGMGIVYLAERRDADYVQSVALKLLTTGAAYIPEVVTRFVAERQILAELNHPNIAHLVDGGRLPDGRPFLAMEYVDGERIDRYCATHALSIPQRLQLFMKVCAAVHYAHQHLVIHRDLKPANIFVTADGQPKLLDFGIARILGANPHIVSAHTVEGQAPLTLAYASPEQVEGQPLTTVTDIYSLGVLLYELLSGTHPFPREMPALELARRIRETEPSPPSRASKELAGVTTSRWRTRTNALAGDLDAIVLKAMRKKPEERYQTAAELAADIGLYLDGKAVTARRGEGWYRARKFLDRHRYAAAVATIIAGMLILFAVDRSYQLKKTEKALAVSEKVTDYFVGLFTAARPLAADGQDISARALLKRGTDRLETRLEGEDLVKLKLFGALGDSLQSIGAKTEANDALEKGLKLAESSAQSDPQTIAHFLNALAWLRIRQGQFPAAGELAQRALSILRAEDSKTQLERGFALRYLGTAKSETYLPFEQIAPLFAESIAAMRAASAPALELAQTHYLLARAYMKQNRFAEAIASLDDVLAVLPQKPETEAQRASYMITKANALQHANRPQEAQEIFAAIRPKLEAVYQDTPAELDSFYTNYSHSDILLGHNRHAVSLFEHLAELCKTRSCPEDQAHQFDRLLNHGRALVGVNNPDAAHKLFEEASRIADAMPAASAIKQKIMIRTAMAEGYTKAHQYERALALVDEAADLAPKLGVAAASMQGLIENERLRALVAAQRWDDAEKKLDSIRGTPAWSDDFTLYAIRIDAARQHWADVSRDMPPLYQARSAMWGACGEIASALREDWLRWRAQGAPVPPSPDSDVKCND